MLPQSTFLYDSLPAIAVAEAVGVETCTTLESTTGLVGLRAPPGTVAHLLADRALDTRPVPRLGALLGEVTNLVAVAAGDSRGVAGLVALSRLVALLTAVAARHLGSVGAIVGEVTHYVFFF